MKKLKGLLLTDVSNHFPSGRRARSGFSTEPCAITTTPICPSPGNGRPGWVLSAPVISFRSPTDARPAPQINPVAQLPYANETANISR